MDFKGEWLRSGRLHPLTVVDDHSRYAVVCMRPTTNPRDRAGTPQRFERLGSPRSS